MPDSMADVLAISILIFRREGTAQCLCAVDLHDSGGEKSEVPAVESRATKGD